MHLRPLHTPMSALPPQPKCQILGFFKVYDVIIYVAIYYVVVVCRVVHSFTCAGILLAQYIKFCDEFGGIGHVWATEKE